MREMWSEEGNSGMAQGWMGGGGNSGRNGYVYLGGSQGRNGSQKGGGEEGLSPPLNCKTPNWNMTCCCNRLHVASLYLSKAQD